MKPFRFVTLPSFAILWTICISVVTLETKFASSQESRRAPVSIDSIDTLELTVDSIQARSAAVQDNKELESALKTRLLETYVKIQDAIRLTTESNSRAERYAKQIRENPQLLQSSREDLALPATELSTNLPANPTLGQAQQRLSDIESQLADAQQALKNGKDEPKRRADRRVEILKLGETSKTQLEDLDEKLGAKPNPDEASEVSTANHLLLEAKKRLLLAEAATAQAELRFYEADGELLPIKRDLAAKKVAQLESLVKRLRDDVNELRRRDIARQEREARRVATHAHPALQAIADRNAELSKLRQALAGQIEEAVRSLDQLNSRVALVDNQFARISKRVDVGQHNQSIGLLLRKQRAELPDIPTEWRIIRARAANITSTGLRLIDYEEERNELATLDQRLKDVLDGLAKDVAPDERVLLEDDVREMLKTQRNYLDAMIADTNSYLDKLTEQDTRDQELITKAKKYSDFCNERILWIRSAPSLAALSPGESWPPIRQLMSLSRWQSVASVLWSECKANPWSTGTLVLLWLGCFMSQRRLRSLLNRLGEQATRGSCRNFLLTVEALLVTVLMAAVWPSLSALIGLRLATAESPSILARSLGNSLLSLSISLGALECYRQITRPLGLGEAHFGWDAQKLMTIRRGVLYLMGIGLPIAMIVFVTEAQPNESVKNCVGRLAFMALNCLLLLPLYRLTHPKNGLYARDFQRDRTAWWSRIRWLWLGIAMAAPLLLIGLAAIGFYYTALQLAGRMMMTVWLMIALIVVYSLLLRWSLIEYRNLGMQRLQERRAAAEAATATSPPVPNTQLEIKLSDINQQTRRMLQLVVATGLVTGLWWIWAPVVPAFGVLRHIILWTPAFTPGRTVQLAPITLADLILSLVTLSLTIAVSRNIPSILELMVLKRLPLDAGARYATGTVVKYLVAIVGIFVAFATVGFEWSQVQWLVAAVSVGLGFGLQEIFANFVSGLVLLFERPIRIGDIVTIGDVEGKVSSIRMRATTITDWDMRELVVPNKELITSRLINWTLSTTVSRMSVAVGVAYDSNPDQVRSLLLDVAQKHPQVLKDPPSHALLDNFGPSTLGFLLRVHMPSRDVYVQLRHELMTQIASRFHEAGIAFAFPKCDVRLQSVESIDLSALNPADKKTGDLPRNHFQRVGSAGPGLAN